MIFRKLFIRFPNGLSKAVTLSYDDGVSSDIKMIELMKKYGIKGTFNLNSGLFTSDDECTERKNLYHLMEKELINVYDPSVCEVATHSVHHPSFKNIPSHLIADELLGDRKNLERIFSKIIKGHALPYGNFNDKVYIILKDLGFSYSRTVNSTHNFMLPDDFLVWNPTCHHNDPELSALTKEFISLSPIAPRIFYLWGHSFEFEKQGNWNILEDFFKQVSNRSDIWFATNIEIHDYINAFNQLIFSCDGSIISNPTATDIWVEIDKQIITIPHGEYIYL